MKEVEASNKIITGPQAKNTKKREDQARDGRKKITLEYILPENSDIDVVPVIVGNGKGYSPGERGGTGIISTGNNDKEDDDRKGDDREDDGTTRGGGIGIITGGGKGPITDTPTKGDGDSTGKEEPSKDDGKKLGHATKRGVFWKILMIMLMVGIVTAKDVEYTIATQDNDYEYDGSVSDLYPEEIGNYKMVQDEDGNWVVITEGEEIQYAAEQVRNPGDIISDLRERALGEELGRRSGREKYDNIPEDERVEDENRINEISQKFDDLLKVIKDARTIIEDSNATSEEKAQALEKIRDAKEAQYNLFTENQDLFNKYMTEAENAYTNPADERTADDYERLVEIANEWEDSQENLKGDMKSVEMAKDTLENPQIMFEEPSAPVGTKEEDYYIEIPGIGPFEDFKALKAEENEVVDLVYESDVNSREAQNNGDGQEQEGIINTDATENVTIKTTRYGINAMLHDFKSFGKGLLEQITGKNLTDPGYKSNDNNERGN